MLTAFERWLVVGILLVSVIGICTLHSASAADWYASADGKPDGAGTKDSPWDLQSALEGKQKIVPGDTLWVLPGTYKYPDRKLGSPGYVVKLAGQKERPIHVRGLPGQRTTIDGGLSVQAPSSWLWIWDLEIIVSENFTMPRRVEEPGSHPQSYNRPWGGLHIHAGEGCKFIHLLIHDNAQGVSWWKGSTNSELYGCIIYDNGWSAPDRGHGHAIYTQNQDGIKTIAECIMTGGYSYTMHAYGSSQAYVDNYLIEGNVAYNGGTCLVGGRTPQPQYPRAAELPVQREHANRLHGKRERRLPGAGQRGPQRRPVDQPLQAGGEPGKHRHRPQSAPAAAARTARRVASQPVRSASSQSDRGELRAESDG
jgi:hypothetical protein